MIPNYGPESRSHKLVEKVIKDKITNHVDESALTERNPDDFSLFLSNIFKFC